MDNYKELIEQYNANMASTEDMKQLEELLEEGIINLSQLEDVSTIENHLKNLSTAEPDQGMDAKFYTMLANEKRISASSFSERFSEWWDSIWQVELQWAYSLALVLVGGIGVYVWQGSSNDKIDQLTSEMGEMKELMMLTMLEQNSVTDRLKAVSLSNDMDGTSTKVATALIDVLRHDENNNVRLAAIDALGPYTNDAGVRKDLIESIQFQKSPLLQLALAELMVAINEKKSIKEFNIIIDSEETPDDVKVELERAMQVLI